MASTQQTELLATEERYRAFLVSAGIGVAHTDPAGRFLLVDPKFCQITGYPADELLGRRLAELFHPEDLGKDDAAWRTDGTGSPRTFEARFVRKGGATFWGSLSVAVVRDAAGRASCFLSALQDRSEYKRAEEIRTLEHAVTRSLADAADESGALRGVIRAVCETEGWQCGRYFAVDETDHVLRFREAWAAGGDAGVDWFIETSRAKVYRRGEGLTGSVWQSGRPLWVKDASRDARASGSSRVAPGVRGSFVFPVSFAGATLGVLSFSSPRVREPDERLMQAIEVIGSQIGQFIERKRAEAELQRFRLALDHSADIVVIIDRATMRLVDVNRTACRLLGYSREELLRMGPQDILPLGREKLEQLYDDLIADPSRSDRMQSYYRCKDGSELPFESTRHVLRSGDAWLIAAVSRDIRSRLVAEQTLREREAGLRRAQRMAKLAHVVTGTDGGFESWSDTLPELVGLSPNELPRTTRDWIGLMHAEDAGAFRASAIAAARTGAHQEIKYRLRRRDGTWIYVRQSMEPLDGVPDAQARWFNTIQDVTDQREAEDRIGRLNRVYATLSGINTLIVRAQSREELYRGACRIAVADGRFPKAWIGTVDPASKSVQLVASHGAEPSFFQRLATALQRQAADAGIVAQAIRERRPAISNDIEHDPRVLGREAAVASGSRALAVLPLMVGDDVAGVLVLHAGTTGFYDQDEITLLNELARDISFALQNLDKEARLGRLQRVNAVLSSVNAAIVRIRDRRELLRECCRIAVEAGELRLAWIGIVERRSERIVPAAFAGPEQGFLRIVRLSIRPGGEDYGLAGRAAHERIPVVSNDVAADMRAARRAESTERGFRAVAMIPLLVGGAAVGVLGLHAAETGFFDHDEMQLVKEMAANIAFALEHIDKEEKVRRLTRVHAVLSGIDAAILRIRDRQEMLQEACRIAAVQGQFPLAWIAALDAENQQVTPVAWSGDDRGFMQLIRPTVAAAAGRPGLSAKAILSGRPVICNDIEADDNAMRYAKEALERGYRSAVALPLRVDGAATGALVLHAAEVGFFDEEEMKLLEELAGDISFALEHIEKRARLDYLAYYDELTGLANRTLFHERLTQHLQAAGKEDSRVAVVIIDIERFKTINDTLGRHGGDELLRQIAAGVRRHVADATRLARLGADHFALLVPGAAGEEELTQIVESRMREFFGEPYRVLESDLRIAAKAGVALFPTDGTDAEALLRNAEAALRKAKTSGERLLFYTPQMTARVAEKLSLENKLRQALERDEFVLHYQPKVDLETRAIVGVEALIRWQSPELGLVPPGTFISLLEETGLVLQAGSWALKQAAADRRRWLEQGLNAPRVAVNVSPIQLRQRDFVRTVEQVVMREAAGTAGLDLEITESVIMESIQTNIEKLLLLRKLGVAVAIDDFGTGYSSLSYLARLPLETLKIDRSFIITMLEDPNTATLVRTIIGLAHSFGLKVVAEGVETEEQANLLRLLRCNQMQGYLFSRPVPHDALAALLQKETAAKAAVK